MAWRPEWDAAGHKGALDANGYTLGVLGGGIDTIYPVENFNLYQQVYQMAEFFRNTIWVFLLKKDCFL